MKSICVAAILVLALACSSGEASFNAQGCLVFSNQNAHEFVTWVNDEPVGVCDATYAGYNSPVWVTLRKGDNTLRFTASRLPEETGPTTISVIRGSIFTEFDTLRSWTISEEKGTSPTWVVTSKKDIGGSLKSFEDVGAVDEATRKQVFGLLDRLYEALEKKDPRRVGLDPETLNRFMAAIGFKENYLTDIFAYEDYQVERPPAEEVRMIAGKKTILVYRQHGGPLFSAGHGPQYEAPDGEMVFSYGVDKVMVVKEGGKYRFLWPEWDLLTRELSD